MGGKINEYGSIGKSLTINHPTLMSFATGVINDLPFNNRIKLRNRSNTFLIDKSILKKCKVNVNGRENRIIVNKNCLLINCKIYINGSNNTIFLGERVTITDGELWIEDSNNNISINEHTCIAGKTHLACMEGCNITIGKNCLFSSDVVFRTGDSHSVLDMEGNRINPSQDIVIKDHVWIGNKTIINKGVTILENSIVGTGAIVTKSIEKPNVVIGGIPAKIIKENINWDANRI